MKLLIRKVRNKKGDDRTKVVDLTGKRFGKLFVIRRYGYTNGKKK